MSAGFQAVQWNRAKIIYDAVVIAGVIAYVAAFLAIASWINPPKNAGEAIGLRIQAFGTCAFIMLTVILSIGPLARLDRRFLPLLYNRRHLGVMTFCVVLVHVWFMIDWYLAQNALPNLANELTDWASYGRFIGFPFKVLGIAALLVMFLMAATSHDYWLAFFSPRIWKGLHMLVYVAYGLVAMHVALGAMQDKHPLLVTIMLIAGFGTVTTLHIVAGQRERATDDGVHAGDDGWIPVGRAALHPRQGRPHRREPRRRTHRGVSRRRPDRRAHQSVRPPGRTDRRRLHHRRPRDLSVARLPVPARGRLRPAAVHGEARDASGTGESRCGRGGPEAACRRARRRG